MAEDKKISPREAALAVLAKAHEMLEKSEFMKAEPVSKQMDMEAHKVPKGEIQPKEHVEGEASAPGKRIEGQIPPGSNPKEQAEGNNPEWGAEPGHYKLAKFCGHMSAKRKMRG